MRNFGRVGQSLIVACATVLALCAGVAPAMATKYDIQASNVNYKYGSSAYVLVNSNPSVVYQKVTGLIAYRTDWTALAEIGHYWTGGGTRQAFYVWTDTFGLNTYPLGTVASGSTQRYHTGYAYGDGKQYFWHNNVIVAKRVVYPLMTSQWPGINVERDTVDMNTGDNVGCFTGLKYKNYDWGSWSNWTAVRLENDTDPKYKLDVVNATHADFVFGY